jgi:protein-tyrosine phosphatase
MADKTSENVDALVTEGRSSGYAIHAEHEADGGWFEVTLFSNIDDNLWMGGCPYGDVLLEAVDNPRVVMAVMKSRFDAILSLFPWGRYSIPAGVEHKTVEMYDSAEQAFDQVDELAMTVVGWLEEGKRVLVHCQAGLNRSALITARVLMIWKGYSAFDAIALIREKRDKYCLCNKAFEDWLLAHDGNL